ncbi:unnamed protein product [Didymodactylos carnosus]|uniref:Mitochondrial carrier protein n=1 Tax=Didymodactylos carnosus TaxID=1234261 RepID=A0A814AEH8_9BILA|nr:unnamed protein product [Didymodactylos carnosus]CAF1106607.1 unnamed protein product [Didymodactylos carnosus]CAF3692928.1 unnamed protein product [Didymodactylos carnosus]CAF3870532.1 unnamed protein product [Didymodactylos carnosus]
MLFPTQQILSTSIGAMCTALLMTPFDVVRIRMQSENKPFAKGDCFVYRTGLMDHVCTCFNGQDPVPWYNRQINGKYSSTIDALVKITRSEGLRSLWSGLSPTLIMSLPNTVIYFTTYEQLKCALGYNKKNQNPIIPAFSGAMARIAAVIVTSPLELVRTKKMSEKLSYSDLISKLGSSIELHGLKTLWRGLIPTIWRDVPFSIFYWSAYERLKLYIIDYRGYFNTLNAFYCGATAGGLATVLTHPFDTVKTYRQVQIGQVYSENRQEGTLKILNSLHKSGGIAGLYKGFVPRLLKVAPACGIMIGSIEFFRGFFQRRSINP